MAPARYDSDLTELAEHALVARGVGPNPGFHPDQIILTKGSLDTPARRAFADKVRAAFPGVPVQEQLDRSHMAAAFAPKGIPLAEKIARGKRTLVLGVLKKNLSRSSEAGIHCPNYWHFSTTGFCWYDCAYCYLAGSCSSIVAPTVKIFVNIEDVLERLRSLGRRLAREGAGQTSCYLGKLQDGLSLDWLTGFSRALARFFAREDLLRWVVLTKSACVDNLLDLDHRGHTIVSWSVSPARLCDALDRGAPALHERLAAAMRCADAGYPVRFLIMPLIPLPDWRSEYGDLVDQIFDTVAPARITMGGICSYPTAARLTTGRRVAYITQAMAETHATADGRRRYAAARRVEMYGAIAAAVRRRDANVPIGLCLEERSVWERAGLDPECVRCNCVWGSATVDS